LTNIKAPASGCGCRHRNAPCLPYPGTPPPLCSAGCCQDPGITQGQPRGQCSRLWRAFPRPTLPAQVCENRNCKYRRRTTHHSAPRQTTLRGRMPNRILSGVPVSRVTPSGDRAFNTVIGPNPKTKSLTARSTRERPHILRRVRVLPHATLHHAPISSSDAWDRSIPGSIDDERDPAGGRNRILNVF